MTRLEPPTYPLPVFIILFFNKHLLSSYLFARHSIDHFGHTISYNQHNDPVKQILLSQTHFKNDKFILREEKLLVLAHMASMWLGWDLCSGPSPSGAKFYLVCYAVCQPQHMPLCRVSSPTQPLCSGRQSGVVEETLSRRAKRHGSVTPLLCDFGQVSYCLWAPLIASSST